MICHKDNLYLNQCYNTFTRRILFYNDQFYYSSKRSGNRLVSQTLANLTTISTNIFDRSNDRITGLSTHTIELSKVTLIR